MKEILLLKFGEIVLKGLNRASFEDRLAANVRRRLKELGQFDVYTIQSTMYVRPLDESADMDRALEAMQKVYGIAALARAAECEKSLEAVCKTAVDYCGEALSEAKTFRVEARRSDKSFPLTSPKLAAEVGGAVLEAFPHLKVDLEHPDVTVRAEIRDRAAYVHAGNLPGAGGMPVGTGGKAVLLLSGGIDSPVAGHMMAKRGVELLALHFESPPYTSPRARQKVFDLAAKMEERCGHIVLCVVKATDMQEKIRANCPEDLFTLIFRRMMVRVACELAQKNKCGALITGESLGQVASQTMAALAATDAASTLPVLRPCVGLDKDEIIHIARQTGTFEISILPYEDCCTLFTPRHPKTKPRLEQLERAEQTLDIDALVCEALESAEFVRVR